jgi:hypothetical protein
VAFAREALADFWLARHAGKRDWVQADAPHEAIRTATLLPPKKRVRVARSGGGRRKRLEEADLAGSGADPGEVRCELPDHHPELDG